MKINMPNTPKGKQELNEDIRQPEQILTAPLKSGKYAKGMALTQPKADGVFLSITSDSAGRVLLLSKDGNVINLETSVHQAIIQFMAPLTHEAYFEAELQPAGDQWSHKNKARLAGNLYNGKKLDFPVEVVLHDAVPLSDIAGQTATKAIDRYRWLRDMAAQRQLELPGSPVSVIDGELLPLQEVRRRFEAGWQEGKARNRVMWKGEPFEGLVIKDPDAIYTAGRATNFKVKPFFSIDAEILSAEAKPTKTGRTFKCLARDTKNPVNEFTFFTGLTPEAFDTIDRLLKAQVSVIVEIEVLGVVDKISHANPTFKGLRLDKMDPAALQPAEPAMDLC